MTDLLTFRMCADVQFNKPLTKDDYVSPGGYEMIMNGKAVSFDFDEYCGTIDRNDPTILHMEMKNPDYDTFDNLYEISKNDLQNVSEIPDFFVLVGDTSLESDLKPITLKKLSFILPNENYEEIPVSSEICKKANVWGNFQNIQEETKKMNKKIKFASGTYFNMFGNGDVFIILNEANSKPTLEEAICIQERVEKVMDTEETLSKESLEQKIEFELSNLETELECLAYGYQLFVFAGTDENEKAVELRKE